MGAFLRRVLVAIPLSLLLGLEACTSTPSRFYMLNAPAALEAIEPEGMPHDPVIGVGPIILPKYLDRPQIVTRTGDNRLALAEFERWAEPLPDNVSRVMAAILERLVPTDQVLLYPWPRSTTLDYQVMVEVLQFDSWLGRESRLVALWSILDGTERPLVSQRTFLYTPVAGGEYDATVAAMSQLLEWFGRDLALTIQHLASRIVAAE